MLILYGSQTGCAQEVAERLSRQARRIKLEFQLSAMDSYDIKNLINEKLVVFICSTTGQGEMPDNMLSTWKFLIRKNLPSSILSSIQFAVFGLGDSSYQKYNYSAKKLFKRMQQLGAIPLLDRGDGDDQHELGIDGALDPWIDKLWSSINEKFTIPHFNLLNDVSLPEQTYRVVFDGVDLKVSEIQENIASVISNQRVTPASHFQDVRHLEFDISKSNKTYSAGEVIQFRPKNISSEINSVIDFLNYQDIADKNVTLIPTSKYVLIPKHWKVQSIRQLLESHIDIFGHPKRYFFELLSFFTIGEHSIKLKHLSSAQGQGDLYEYNHKVKRTYFEVIVDFNAVIPIDYIFDLIPDIKPRSFSISSSIKVFVFNRR